LKRFWACLVFAGGFPAFAQYAGPAVLSRGEAPSLLSLPDIKFRPFFSVTESYDTGLSNVGVNDTGDLANQVSLGTNITWGVSGVHNWRRTKVSLNYRGSLSHYSKSQYDSANHSLLFELQHQLARHVGLHFSTSAGLFRRDFGLLGLPQTSLYDPSTASIPTTDFFDNRTLYVTSVLGLTIQKSARLSFNMAGSVFLTRRRSRALYGSTGESAQGDMQYRISRMSTIGVNYSFSHFAHTRVYGSTVAHAVAGTYSRSLTRSVQFSGYAGVVRPEVTFVQSVAIDPAIVALLGITSGTRIVHTTFYSPNVGARLSRSLENGVLYAGASHGITPGNGLFLTSVVTTLNGGYSYTGLRRWSMNANVSYSIADSKQNLAGEYRTLSGAANIARSLGHGFNFILNYSARKYLSDDYAKYNRVIHQVTAGIGWSPGEIPLRIW